MQGKVLLGKGSHTSVLCVTTRSVHSLDRSLFHKVMGVSTFHCITHNARPQWVHCATVKQEEGKTNAKEGLLCLVWWNYILVRT